VDFKKGTRFGFIDSNGKVRAKDEWGQVGCKLHPQEDVGSVVVVVVGTVKEGQQVHVICEQCYDVANTNAELENATLLVLR